MAYDGPIPTLVKDGGTADTSITGIISGAGTAAFSGNTITQYNTLVGGSSNAITSINPGVAGQAFTSTSASSNPVYSSPTCVWLSTQSASLSTTIDFNSLITSKYKTYLFNFYNYVPQNNGRFLAMRFSTDNGGSFISSGYIGGMTWAPYNSTTITNSNASTDLYVTPSEGNTAGITSGDGFVWLMNTSSSTYSTIVGRSRSNSGAATSRYGYSTGSYLGATAINSVQFLIGGGGTGAISTGTFVMYGIG